MGRKVQKEFLLIEHGVDEVGVVVERVAEDGVEHLQHHPDQLLQHQALLGGSVVSLRNCEVGW